MNYYSIKKSLLCGFLCCIIHTMVIATVGAQCDPYNKDDKLSDYITSISVSPKAMLRDSTIELHYIFYNHNASNYYLSLDIWKIEACKNKVEGHKFRVPLNYPYGNWVNIIPADVPKTHGYFEYLDKPLMELRYQMPEFLLLPPKKKIQLKLYIPSNFKNWKRKDGRKSKYRIQQILTVMSQKDYNLLVNSVQPNDISRLFTGSMLSFQTDPFLTSDNCSSKQIFWYSRSYNSPTWHKRLFNDTYYIKIRDSWLYI